MLVANEFLNQVKPHNAVLKGMALKLIHSEPAAQDLLQDTLHRALVNLDKFKQGTNLKAWLITIMKNIFINSYRKKKRRNSIIVDGESIYDSQLLNASNSIKPVDNIILKEVLDRSLSSIKEELRVPFKMYFEGYKYQEIGEALDIPLGTVKSRIYFARQELVQLLAHEGITNSSLI